MPRTFVDSVVVKLDAPFFVGDELVDLVDEKKFADLVNEKLVDLVDEKIC
jgi:hypothetical protein